MTAAASRRREPRIRPAGEDDLAAVTAIYAHHVLTGLATFEETAPDADEMRRRHDEVQRLGLPFLVAELEGGVRGFAYATPYRERSAYRYTVEDSIYVDGGWERRGIATELLTALIERCAALELHQMIAVIGDSANARSIALHARTGFRVAGVLPEVGFKFGRWVDSVIMTRPLERFPTE